MWKACVLTLVLAELLLAPAPASAQTTTGPSSCPTLSPPYAAPVVASGWTAQLIAAGLTSPRSLVFDSHNNLLVLQAGQGVINLQFTDGGGTCLNLVNKTQLVTSTDLNHGLAISPDEMTIYASSSASVFSWTYNPQAKTVGNTNHTVITGMDNPDHTTRTLLMSAREPGIMVVNRGSSANIDYDAESLSSGHSQVKAFNLANITDTTPPYDFTTSGRLLGWGLRNSVGIAEEIEQGGIYVVENSVDQVTRDGTDIHEDNPGEELNFLGYLNSSTASQGGNYGYPDCFALWDTNIPNAGNLTVGSRFSMTSNNDSNCLTRQSPRSTFQAHMAPLGIVFTRNASEAIISFHGSWDRTNPTGYKVSTLEFANGSPVEPPQSKTALTDIFTNQNNSNCPDGCFRPVGLAVDRTGRVFVSSDTTGEIWVLVRQNGGSSGGSSTLSGTYNPTAGSTASQTASPTTSGTASGTASPSASQTKSAATRMWSSDMPKIAFTLFVLSFYWFL